MLQCRLRRVCQAASILTVVVGVHDGGVQDSVNKEQSCAFVKLILYAGPSGDLNDGIEHVGWILYAR